MIVYPGKAAGISGGFFRMRRISVLPTPAAAAGGTKFDAFSGSCADPIGGRKAHRLAGHRGVALLNDALLRWPFSGSLSGRIAQLVEQLTLNQRVPGSSPGAPTKVFSDLAPLPKSHSDKRSAAIPTNQLLLFSPGDASWSPKSAASACASRRSATVALSGDGLRRAAQRQ
jgi:hypothetical protein